MQNRFQDAIRRGLVEAGRLLVVDVGRQQLELHDKTGLRTTYRVSTGEAGTGQQDGSGRTPTGWHEIAERIGRDAKIGQCFVSREPTGDPLPESAWQSSLDEDRILTRILRLRGLEPGRNAGLGIDSYQRYIYLHGTNQEHRLGQPVSHGCIRMGNRDIVELAAMIGDQPAWCWIG